MNEKQLAKWLMDLAACYDYLPQKAAIARYLRILGRRKLTTEQWEELADRAVMRLTRRFPLPGELHEIASEINQSRSGIAHQLGTPRQDACGMGARR